MAELRSVSFRSLLTRQWLAFSAIVAAVVAAGALLLAYLVEDGLIDQRLQRFAAQVAANGPDAAQMPPEISVYDLDETPIDIAAELTGRPAGEVFEMRRAGGTNVHVVQQVIAGEDPIVVIYDATDTNVVNAAFGPGLITALVATALFLFVAWLTADRLARRFARQVEALETGMRTSQDPAHLHRLAEDQKIQEFGALLHMHAELWERVQRSVENERNTLAYLAHELRTPLQAATNSLASMGDDVADADKVGRLRRAVGRLHRASTSALWLASEPFEARSAAIGLAPLIDDMVNEFAPLGLRKGQIIVHRAEAEAYGDVPIEIVEAIVANLLQNAVRHGAQGTIEIRSGNNRIQVTNCVTGTNPTGGFGLGLEIVRRLCERCGGELAIAHADDTFTANVVLGPPIPRGEMFQPNSDVSS